MTIIPPFYIPVQLCCLYVPSNGVYSTIQTANDLFLVRQLILSFALICGFLSAMCNIRSSSEAFHNACAICRSTKRFLCMQYRLLRIALFCVKKGMTKTMGDRRVCYQVSVARLTVLAASTKWTLLILQDRQVRLSLRFLCRWVNQCMFMCLALPPIQCIRN